MKPHKDLPPGSQPWAEEVDKLLAEVKELKAVVKRLSQNAGLDYSNPQRGLNGGSTPSINNPVGQKLSSLADVQTYNIADKQVLSWSQQDQQWLPVTSTGLEWRKATEAEHMDWYMSIDAWDSESNKVIGQLDPEKSGAGLVGTSDASAYLRASQKWFGGPTTFQGYVGTHPYYVMLGSVEVEDETGNWNNQVEINVGRGDIYMTTPQKLYGDTDEGAIVLRTNWFYVPQFITSTRPVSPGPGVRGAMIFDDTIGKPLWNDGTIWRDALGNIA